MEEVMGWQKIMFVFFFFYGVYLRCFLLSFHGSLSLRTASYSEKRPT